MASFAPRIVRGGTGAVDIIQAARPSSDTEHAALGHMQVQNTYTQGMSTTRRLAYARTASSVISTPFTTPEVRSSRMPMAESATATTTMRM